ncbi:MAG: ferrous iron transporter B, partial [Bacteroidales bacterium]
RVAWLMDNLMHKIGLHGKSFVPMIMGFGCNVPAIMATRSIENKKDRLLTMLIIPFMSCSARLPVYILLIGTFFPKYPVLVLCILYLFGVLLSILFAIVFKRTIIKTLSTEYEILLPQYKIPTWRSIKPIIWFNTKDYLKKIAGIVLIASVIIWFLFNYPNPHDTGNSFISYIGKFIEPILLPIGFDWKMGIGLLAGISAKELIVSTISVLAPTFTIASAASFLAFVLIYFPCIAVFAVVWKESGKLRWAIFLALYTTILAWIIAFLVYNIALWII